jgi:hypothetical protein
MRHYASPAIALSTLLCLPLALHRPNSINQHSNPPIRGPPQGHTGHSYDQVVREDDDESEDYEDDEYESGMLLHTCILAAI